MRVGATAQRRATNLYDACLAVSWMSHRPSCIAGVVNDWFCTHPEEVTAFVAMAWLNCWLLEEQDPEAPSCRKAAEKRRNKSRNTLGT